MSSITERNDDISVNY